MLVDIFHYKAPLLQNIPAIGKPIASSIQGVDTIIKVSTTFSLNAALFNVNQVLTSDIVNALPVELVGQARRAQVELSESLEKAIKSYNAFEKLAMKADANGAGSWMA